MARGLEFSARTVSAWAMATTAYMGLAVVVAACTGDWPAPWIWLLVWSGIGVLLAVLPERGWPAPWGIEYQIDLVGAFVVTIVSGVSTAALAFARRLVAAGRPGALPCC